MAASSRANDAARWLRTLSASWFIRLEYERGEWQFNRKSRRA